MSEIEQMLWALTYAAATAAREPNPATRANDALIHFQVAMREDGPDPFPPEYDPDGDVPF